MLHVGRTAARCVTLRAHIAVAAVLLTFGIGTAWWAVASGRITLGTLTIRTLAALGLLAVAQWAADLTRALRRHRRG